MKIERYVIFFLLIALYSQIVRSQDSLKSVSPTTSSVMRDSSKQDTSSIILLKHSPTKAALLSAVLPGLGQIYNKKYWKLPIIYAGIGVSAYFLVYNQSNYKKYYEGLVNYSNTRKPYSVQDLDLIKPWMFERGRVDEALNFYTDQFRRNRDWSFIFLAGTYVLGIVDAAVDAYLFDYDISDDLSVRIEPVITNTLASRNAFGLKLSFNLH